MLTQEAHNVVLKTKNLSIGYSSKKEEIVVASNINIALKKGELIGLIGTNGIGKSTFLRTLTKVQPPISGHVFINNKSLNTYSGLNLAKTLSLVLTEPLASKNFTAFELVALGRQPYTNWIGNLTATDINAVNNALTEINIEHLKHKKCFELSDGQLQKVLIARALAQDTDIIILDEPTTHLDMYHKARTLKLLKELAKNTNKTILFSSHEIDLAIQLCDEMIVMTKNDVVINTPCNLISSGIFNALFPEDLIAFDETSGSFKINKNI